MGTLNPLTLPGRTLPLPIIQGGMGAGISMSRLAGAVGNQGGLGIVSSVALDRIVSRRLGRRLKTRAATAYEVEQARDLGGFCGINIMVALQRDFDDSVRGALDGGVDYIFSGAGLPLTLPSVVDAHQPGSSVGLVPIISSPRALALLCKRWERQGWRPAAAVLEGPLAGGHLGFKNIEELNDPASRLEVLLPPTLEVAEQFGGFPVIVAGGVYTYEDILAWQQAGAAGVQMGTRFLATEESEASDHYKQSVVAAGEQDITVVHKPGSPCGYPFRILRTSPMWQDHLLQLRPVKCDKGYVLYNGECIARTDTTQAFCICNGLLAARGDNDDEENPIFTVGANASRVDRIVPVSELMQELSGAALVASGKDK